MTFLCVAYNLRKYFKFFLLLSSKRFKKRNYFEKALPVIKVCFTTDNADTSTPTSKPSRTGRKKSAAKLEEEELVKRIKRGQDFEQNERQRNDLEEMNKGAGESFRRLA